MSPFESSKLVHRFCTRIELCGERDGNACGQMFFFAHCWDNMCMSDGIGWGSMSGAHVGWLSGEPRHMAMFGMFGEVKAAGFESTIAVMLRIAKLHFSAFRETKHVRPVLQVVVTPNSACHVRRSSSPQPMLRCAWDVQSSETWNPKWSTASGWSLMVGACWCAVFHMWNSNFKTSPSEIADPHSQTAFSKSLMDPTAIVSSKLSRIKFAGVKGVGLCGPLKRPFYIRKSCRWCGERIQGYQGSSSAIRSASFSSVFVASISLRIFSRFSRWQHGRISMDFFDASRHASSMPGQTKTPTPGYASGFPSLWPG